MTFKQLNNKIQEQFIKMCESGKLFRVNVKGRELWDLYLSSFDEHPIWRVESIHNCDSDRHFFERYANVVAIIDNKIVSLFDFEIEGEYKKSIEAIANKIQNSEIESVFIETFNELKTLGSESVRSSLKKTQSEFVLGSVKTLKEYRTEEEAMGKEIGKVYTYHHFHVYLPKQFVDFSGKSSGQLIGNLNTTRQVFEKGLNIPLETLELVRDLINQCSLLRGDMYLSKVKEFITLKKKFSKITEESNWMWLNFQSIPFARFANELIGTLCIELAEGKEINKACLDFNKRVDPTNYKKAKAPITQKQIELAEKVIEEKGYTNSFERRFANINDISIDEIKHSNYDNSVEKPVGLFGKAGVPKKQFSRHKRSEFDKVEEVTIDKFMSDILPTITSMEILLENRFENHLVALFTAQNKTFKNLFKWNNPFSWTYKGNLSGKSNIKENVKSVGGNINAIVRASLQWNDEDTKGTVDFDLHSKGKNHIYYSNKGRTHSCGGHLDVDMIRPRKIGIENITWKNKIDEGVYQIGVKNYCGANNNGFKVEIEFNNEVYNYHCNYNVKGYTTIATITVKNRNISIKHHLPETNSSKKMWNLDSGQFHKVNLFCTSPNHWGDNKIGTKEYFFMLQDCKTDESMRAFHTDQLNSELMEVRKQIDMLGNYKMVEPTDKQLAGVGFNNTMKNNIIVKCNGSFKRTIKINF